MKYIASLLITLSFLFVSCVEEYTIPQKNRQKHEARLVVEGKILAGTKSIIYLSHTTPIGDFTKGEPIQNANITIIGENGYTSTKAEFDIENSRYTIPTYELPDDTQYALKIELDGETYQSQFQPLLSTPEIEEVIWKEQSEGISLLVSTNGNQHGSRNYMWTYDEDWEIHAEMDFTKPLSVGQWWYNKMDYPIEGENPYLYCWMHNESSLIHIYNTNELTENKVKDQEFLFIPIDDIRISYIYSILVKQACLSDEVYEYYRLMRLYTQESSGIFNPTPTEIEGNVKCISNPNLKINGVVMASNITSKRIFIYASEFQNLTSEYSNCYPTMGVDVFTGIAKDDYGWRSAWLNEANSNGAFIYLQKSEAIKYHPSYTDLNQYSELYPATCMDCRKTKGSTKKRPDFWPNNHE